jgi:hypothetical protein
MRSRLIPVLTALALVAATGCASQRRARRARPAAKPTAEKPKRLDGPVWFTPEGTGDGRTQRPESWADETAARTDRVVPKPDPSRPLSNVESPLGTNLAELGPEGRDWVFVDVFKMAAPWSSYGKSGEDSRLVEQDVDGWVQALVPGQSAVTKIPTLGGGRFVTLYKGRGLIRLGGATVVEDVPGRLVFEAPAHRTVTFEIVTTNTEDHIREIHVVPAAFEATYEQQIFHPLFLQRLSRFSVLRFAGWARVNQPVAPTWDRRVTPKYYTQAGQRGVAYEYMVMLANEVGADLWINIPHQANDELIKNLATFLRNNLEPELKVYLEYSAEVWREGTDPARYASEQGRFIGLATDPVEARVMFQARRSAEVFALFAEGFERARTVHVVSGALDRPQELERLLSSPALGDKVDVLAVAPVVSIGALSENTARTLATMNEGEVLDALEFTSLPALMSRIRAAQRVAAGRGVALVAYAGGQDLRVQGGLPDSEDLNGLFDRVSRDPRTQALYLALLDGWRESGGELFVHGPLVTAYGATGRAGALEWLDQAEGAPRYSALMAFAQNHERWWGKRRPPPVEVDPNAGLAAAVVDPNAGQLATESPLDSTPMVWGAGGAALAAGAMGGVFTGLYLRSAARRDRLVAEEYSPVDGTQAREQDDAAYKWSLAATTSFGVAAVGFGAAAVLNALDEVEPGEGARHGMVLSAGTGVLALGASAVFFGAYLNTLGDRSDRLKNDPNPANAAPYRNLDDEAFKWSLASGASLGVAVASFGVSLILYLTDQPEPYLDEYEGEEAEGEASAVDVTWAPNGMMLRW